MLNIKTYKTRTGLEQFKPSFELLERLAHDSLGFCVGCGEETDSMVEPDARQYVCACCDKPKVYGAEELALMGLAF